MTAADALEQLVGILGDEVVPRVVAARAAEAVGPTRPLQRFGALLSGAEVTQTFGNRHIGQDLVAGHRGSPSSGNLRL
jgi:hypothetical protein